MLCSCAEGWNNAAGCCLGLSACAATARLCVKEVSGLAATWRPPLSSWRPLAPATRTTWSASAVTAAVSVKEKELEVTWRPPRSSWSPLEAVTTWSGSAATADVSEKEKPPVEAGLNPRPALCSWSPLDARTESGVGLTAAVCEKAAPPLTCREEVASAAAVSGVAATAPVSVNRVEENSELLGGTERGWIAELGSRLYWLPWLWLLLILWVWWLPWWRSG